MFESVDYIQFYLEDPGDIPKLWPGPALKLIVVAEISCSWHRVLSEDFDVHQLDAVILTASVNKTTAAGLPSGHIARNCALCGGGLSTKFCHGCNWTFPDNGISMGWGTPLPPKVITLLRASGHEFGLDPERLLV